MSNRTNWLRTVYEDGRHNAFTDIKLFRGRFYVTFRSGEAHGSYDGTIRVLASDDLEKWDQVGHLTTVLDDRDPKLAIREEVLYVIAQCRTPPTPGGEMPSRVQSQIWSTPDGSNWSNAVVGEPIDYVFWRPQEYDGWHWQVAYYCDRADRGVWHVDLLRSTDMHRWEKVSTVYDDHAPNETEIQFLADGTLVAFVRCEDPQMGTPFCIAKPPYTQWEVHEQPLDIRGPLLAQVEGRLYVVGRFMEKAEEEDVTYRDTRLYRVTEDYQLEEMLVLPAPEWAPERAGDNSYAGAHYLGDGELLLSYYSGTSERANIYLISVDIR